MPEEKKAVLASARVTAAARKAAVQDILQKAEILTSRDWAEIMERVFIFGIPAPDHVKYYDKVRAFIDANKLRPVERLKPLPDGMINGRTFVEFQHVHLNNNTYLLDAKQFETLDKELVRDFKFSLKNAGEVKF